MLNKPVYLDCTEIPFHHSVGLFLRTDLCGWSKGNECGRPAPQARISGSHIIPGDPSPPRGPANPARYRFWSQIP
jgi:hypothetical protein